MANKFKKHFTSKKQKMTATLVVLLFVLVALLEITNTTFTFHHQKTTDTIPSTSTGAKTIIPSDTPDKAAPQPSTNNSDKSPATSNSTKESELVAPSGLFVSTHTRSLNSSNSAEYSACTTTPGASCYIQFKQGGIVKELATQIADSNGNTSWYWDVSSAKLTVGEWEVSAVATLNGQSLTAIDQKPLEISQ